MWVFRACVVSRKEDASRQDGTEAMAAPTLLVSCLPTALQQPHPPLPPSLPQDRSILLVLLLALRHQRPPSSHLFWWAVHWVQY